MQLDHIQRKTVIGTRTASEQIAGVTLMKLFRNDIFGKRYIKGAHSGSGALTSIEYRDNKRRWNNKRVLSEVTGLTSGKTITTSNAYNAPLV